MNVPATRTLYAAAAAISLTLLAATPASAAPGDIRAEFTTTPKSGGGNTVSGTFTATGDNLPTYCNMIDPNSYVAEEDEFLLFGQTFAGAPTPIITVTDNDVPDGTYTIEWYCTFDGSTEIYDGTVWWLGPGYQQPTTLVVPAVEPNCTGSVCLPTGSSGF